jgi:hypothetical protein
MCIRPTRKLSESELEIRSSKQYQMFEDGNPELLSF